jgi:hypothetical protein
MLPQFISSGTEGDQFNTYTYKLHELGTKMVFGDGRAFRFVLNGATLARAGYILQTPVQSNNSGLVVATHAVGDRAVTVTFGGAVTLNQYTDGFLYRDSAADGVGTLYKIKSHTAFTTGLVNLWTPLREAIVAADTVTCIMNPYRAVVEAATIAMPPVGVACTAIPASGYGWVQTKGICAVMHDTAGADPAITGYVVMSAARAGECTGMTAAGDDQTGIGIVVLDEADANFIGVMLTLD